MFKQKNTKMKKTIYLGLLLSLTSLVKAQDVHFSNPDYAPLTLNPALAGVNHNVQLFANYRTQWNSVGAPFQTISASADFQANADNMERKGILAMGIQLFNDRIGEAAIATNNVNFNLAYHVMLDRYQTVGLGMYGGFGQRSLSFVDGTFGNQYINNAFDPTAGTGENLGASPNFSFFELGAGLVYNFNGETSSSQENEGLKVTAGYAVYHINTPSFSFTGNGDDPLYMRHSVFARGSYGVGKSAIAVEPGMYYHMQGPNNMFMVGSDVRFFLKSVAASGETKYSSAAIGAYLRNNDAFIARAMYQFNGLGAGFSYDFNTSSLNEVTRSRGGMELFLVWQMDGRSQKLVTN